MARWCEPTAEQEQGWKDWLKDRPAIIQELGARFNPWELYLLKTSNHRVTVLSFNEDNTVTVAVSGQFNQVMFERQVFGIKPDDLEPCELPGPDEPSGAIMSQDEVDENIDALRLMGRPDLWELKDGKAVLKS